MEALRRCITCGIEAYTRDDLELFKKRATTLYGRCNMCKSCCNKTSTTWRELNPEGVKANNKYWYPKQRDKTYLTKYGITLETYNNMLDAQDGCCYICKKHENDHTRKLAVDHNHNTGEVRGLLCTQCNIGLGMFKDNIKNLETAIKYLKGEGPLLN